MRTLILIALAGAIAQLVDGALGMGFGATSTTMLILAAGLGPAQASAVVHTAELGTTLASGISHWRFGNVDWRLALRLGVPGAVGAFLGAYVLSNLSTAAAAPVTAGILTAIGLHLLLRFSRGAPHHAVATDTRRRGRVLGLLGLTGGFIDASGGGGWGPVTASTLMSLRHAEPRRVVGTVNTSEFLVTAAATTGFAIGMREELLAHLPAVAALLVGGVIAAPFAAWLVSRMQPGLLGGAVGTALMLVNAPRVVGALDTATWVLPTVEVALLALGVGLTCCGVRRMRKRAKVRVMDEAAPEVPGPVERGCVGAGTAS